MQFKYKRRTGAYEAPSSEGLYLVPQASSVLPQPAEGIFVEAR
jgi:hypothetical protein